MTIPAFEALLRSARPGVHAPITCAQAQAMWDRVPSTIWRGSDGGQSLQAPGGRQVWFFGDSLTSGGAFHSMVMFQEGGRMDLRLQQIIPNEPPPSKVVYWAGFATRLSHNKYLVAALGIIPTDDGWFEVAPNKGAYLTIGDDAKVSFDGFAPHWPHDKSWSHPVLDGSKLHFFAPTQDPADGFRQGVFHRSVQLEQIADPAAYSPTAQAIPYETDGSWSPWKHTDGTWKALSLAAGATDALIYSAATLDGPWTKQVYRGVVPRPKDASTYVAHAHPEVKLLNGHLACTVSVSRPWGKPWDNRPRWFTIPLESTRDWPTA